MDVPPPLRFVAFTTLASKDPLTSRSTIVEAPLAEEAVVLAFDMVPEVMLEALIFVPPEISPEIFAVIVLAEKLPPASRETIVEAPLAEAAVVRELAIVPDEMLLALMDVKVVPAPIKFDAVMLPASKAPLASRSTIVLALLDVLPVVRALSRVPDVMFEALIAVKATPLPEMLVALTVVAFTVLAVKSPLESRKTMVFAPFDADAVVLALSKVPRVILEALIAALAALVICP